MITDEDIKVGQKYKLELLCIHSGEKVIIFETPTGDHIPLRNGDRECVTSINPYEPLKLYISNRIPETYPKYDPCRPFKKGDRVAPKFWNGRPPVASEERANSEFLPENKIYTVLADERNSIAFIDYHGKRAFIPVNHLELVTPAEARFHFRVGDFPVDGEWSVWKDSIGKTEIISSYKIATHPNAKAAAEAERDRLNAEWRKEQK